MSSIDYSILEIFCPARQETLHITSLYLKSLEEGYTEILPLHKAINLTLASQLLLVKKEGNSETLFGLNVTEGILNIIHPAVNRTLINISVYDFDWVTLEGVDFNNIQDKQAELQASGISQNQFQSTVLKYDEIIAKSDEIIKSELVPRYNSHAQELRNVEQDIKIEFEKDLKR